MDPFGNHIRSNRSSDCSIGGINDESRMMMPSAVDASPSRLTPTMDNRSTICRRIQFMIPKDLPMLSEQAVDPNFFKASNIIQEISCNSNKKNAMFASNKVKEA